MARAEIKVSESANRSLSLVDPSPQKEINAVPGEVKGKASSSRRKGRRRIEATASSANAPVQLELFAY